MDIDIFVMRRFLGCPAKLLGVRIDFGLSRLQTGFDYLRVDLKYRHQPTTLLYTLQQQFCEGAYPFSLELLKKTNVRVARATSVAAIDVQSAGMVTPLSV